MRRDELEFGEDLVQRGAITKTELDEAISYAKSRRQDLRRSLADAKILAIEIFDQHRAEYFGIPYMNLANFHADPQVLALLPEDVCRNEELLPLFQTETSLAVAVADPTNLVAIDQIRNDTGLDIDLYYAPSDAILVALETNYSAAILALGDGPEASVQEQDVPKIVDTLLKRAVRDGASDVHIEPGDTQLLVRQRVDGCLQEVRAFSKHLQANMVSRVKILANLDISETRVPQDGNVEMNIAGEDRKSVV